MGKNHTTAKVIKNATIQIPMGKNHTTAKVIKNATIQIPSYGEPTALCFTQNSLAIFVSKDSGSSWEAVSGSGCTSSSGAYTNIAICGKANVTLFTHEQACTGTSQ